MKAFFSLTLTALALSATSATAQNRDLAAQRMILDNGTGNRLTLEYTGTGNSTLTFGNGPFAPIPAGTSNGQMLRWDNTNMLWETAPGLMHDGDLNLTSGSLLLTNGIISSTTGIGHVINVTATSTNDAVNATATGTQNAGQFTIDNIANVNHAIVATTNGSGDALHGSSDFGFGVFGESDDTHGIFGRTFSATGYGAQFLGMTPGAGGVFIGAGNGGKALNIYAGSLKGSYATIANGDGIPADAMVTLVGSGGADATPANATLPGGMDDGTILIVATADPDGLTVNGLTTAASKAQQWVMTAAGWKSIP
jgi:hypothetical protein